MVNINPKSVIRLLRANDRFGFNLPLSAVHLTADSRSANGYQRYLGKANGDYMGMTHFAILGPSDLFQHRFLR